MATNDSPLARLDDFLDEVFDPWVPRVRVETDDVDVPRREHDF
jgi:hypothetical protein